MPTENQDHNKIVGRSLLSSPSSWDLHLLKTQDLLDRRQERCTSYRSMPFTGDQLTTRWEENHSEWPSRMIRNPRTGGRLAEETTGWIGICTASLSQLRKAGEVLVFVPPPSSPSHRADIELSDGSTRQTLVRSSSPDSLALAYASSLTTTKPLAAPDLIFSETSSVQLLPSQY